MIEDCFHRPGKRTRSGIWLCRHCGVAIEECPHERRKRNEEPCPCCIGSFWVAIVRSRRAKIMECIGAL